MSVIAAQGLRKKFGNVHALDGFDLQVEPGRIVGLIGPNGSGKTTALKSILGMAALDAGNLDVLSFQPKAQRAALMQHVAYIADTGILPRWMRVKDLLEYVDAVNPSFDIALAREALARTDVQLEKKVKVLSKGMHVQLHLAIVLAIGAQLLVLDEPTLGLDILYRQQFYDGVLNDYFNEQRSILITTHEVREVEHILTDVVFIHRGKACLSLAMEALPETFFKLTSPSNQSLPPGALQSRATLAGTESIYNNVDAAQLQQYGEVSTPNLAELFVAVVESQHV
ncbi:MAG: ABC transporter ATP-binding protein [Pseudomonadaceae bacterium]|nr:ABC transporter ATP-binding protein [Pseudomonadaceae bacterium]